MIVNKALIAAAVLSFPASVVPALAHDDYRVPVRCLECPGNWDDHYGWRHHYWWPHHYGWGHRYWWPHHYGWGHRYWWHRHYSGWPYGGWRYSGWRYGGWGGD